MPKMLEVLAVKKKKYDEEAVKRKKRQEETRARNKRNREKRVRNETKQLTMYIPVKVSLSPYISSRLWLFFAGCACSADDRQGQPRADCLRVCLARTGTVRARRKTHPRTAPVGWVSDLPRQILRISRNRIGSSVRPLSL